MKRFISGLITFSFAVSLVILIAGCTAHYSSGEADQPQDIKKGETSQITKESTQDVSNQKAGKIMVGRTREIMDMYLEVIAERFPGVSVRVDERRRKILFSKEEAGYRGAFVVTIRLKPARGIDESGRKIKGYVVDITSKMPSFWTGALNHGWSIGRINRAVPKVMQDYDVSFVSVKNLKMARLQKTVNYASQATGFTLSTRPLVVTNYHVVEEDKEVDIFFPDGQKIRARVIKRDKENDLAIIRFKEFRTEPAGFSIFPSHKVNSGQEIFVIGYPLGRTLGENPSITRGMVAATVGIESDSRHFRITAEINPGNSGGPLIDKQGRVIGVVSHGLNKVDAAKNTGNIPEGANFAIKSSLLLSLSPNLRKLVTEEQSSKLTAEKIFNNYSKFVVIVRPVEGY
jgi:S1-C subfamily serine protease